MFIYLRSLTILALSQTISCVVETNRRPPHNIYKRPRYTDACQEDPNACTMLPECWYVCGGVDKKPAGMGSNVPVDPDGYSTFNSVSGRLGTIAGGERNFLSGLLGTISGGKDNSGTGNLSSVGGGENNKADGSSSVISGGKNNVASGDGAVVPGGKCNTAEHKNSMAFGGRDSDSGDCVSKGATSCNTDEDGQVKFCNPSSVFEGQVAIGNVSISNSTIVGIKTMDIKDVLVIGVKTIDYGLDTNNYTEITKDKMKTPMLETDALETKIIETEALDIKDVLVIGVKTIDYGLDTNNYTEITKDKMKTPMLETEALGIKNKLVIGSDDIKGSNDVESNKTEITKDRMRTPEVDTNMIRLRPMINNRHRRLQDDDTIYTTIDSRIITTELIIATNIQANNIIINGLSISLLISIVTYISFISLILNIILWIYVIRNKHRGMIDPTKNSLKI